MTEQPRLPSRATCYRRFEHYREVEWAFVQLSQFIFETRGRAACRPLIQQAKRYHRLARRAIRGCDDRRSVIR